MIDDTEAARDWRAEDRAGAAAMPAPTKAEEAAILLALDAENTEDDADGWEDDPVCERCGVIVPGGASAFAPFCSAACAR